jgi:cobalt/nickel transport system ATP-binding protein
MNGVELIALRDISFRYHQGSDVLQSLDLTIHAGDRLGLVGPIGSGKTTLLHLIVGLLKPDTGSIEVFGKKRHKEGDFWEVREKVGLLFQDPEDQLFCPTVREDIAFGPLNLGKSRAETEAIVSETLGVLGLESFEDRITHHLSGGEKRLVSLGTVLAMKPTVLLLDEPANGLDPESHERVTRLLQSLEQAMIVVSHDHEFLDSVTDRTVRLANGRIEGATPQSSYPL